MGSRGALARCECLDITRCLMSDSVSGPDQVRLSASVGIGLLWVEYNGVSAQVLLGEHSSESLIGRVDVVAGDVASGGFCASEGRKHSVGALVRRSVNLRLAVMRDLVRVVTLAPKQTLADTGKPMALTALLLLVLVMVRMAVVAEILLNLEVGISLFDSLELGYIFLSRNSECESYKGKE